MGANASMSSLSGSQIRREIAEFGKQTKEKQQIFIQPEPVSQTDNDYLYIKLLVSIDEFPHDAPLIVKNGFFFEYGPSAMRMLKKARKAQEKNTAKGHKEVEKICMKLMRMCEQKPSPTKLYEDTTL